jgi:type I restriction enzyme S subunit
MGSPKGWAELRKATIGSSQAAFTIVLLKGMAIEVPPIPTQRKIAAILSTYDDLIENNLRRIKILEEMAQNLYREWFVKFRFPGHEKTRFVDSPLGQIPEGWEVVKLSELITTQYGYTESTQEKPIGPKYLRGMDINKATYIDWNVVPYCPISDEQFPKYRLAEGDIVIIRMADPGKVGIVEKDVEAVFASYLVRLSRKTNCIGPYYLFYFLIDEKYQGYITGASTGTTRKSASAGVLTGIDILVPTDQLLADFEFQIQAIRKLLNNLLERNTTLRRTRDLLLPKLISGEVDVSELDITIPKEVA